MKEGKLQNSSKDTGVTFCALGAGSDFLETIPKTQVTKDIDTHGQDHFIRIRTGGLLRDLIADEADSFSRNLGPGNF